MKKNRLLDMIMQYEDGTLPVDMTLELFAKLIKTGKAWTLQGSYGKMADGLIKEGYISKHGKILKRF